MKDVLAAHQASVATRFLDEESAKRHHLVVSLSGAHAYGFPSPDSDLDLKAIHVEPAAQLLSLVWKHVPAERLTVIDEVEIDYSSNEVREVLVGLVRGNGNYFERILGHLQPVTSPELEELRLLARAALSRQVHRHYRGFATGQLKAWEDTGFRSAKKLLYVLRTTLTGAHALLEGEIVTDVRELLGQFGFDAARELIEEKRRGEVAELPEVMRERWRREVGRAFEVLDDALGRSRLPDEPRNVDALDAWLLQLRRTSLSRG